MSAALRSAQARAREHQAWQYRLAGLTEAQIAEKLGVKQPSVHAMLRRVETQVLAEARQFVMRVKARQLGRLEFIHTEAIAAWRRSQEKAVTRSSEAVPNDPGDGEGRPQQASQRITKLKVAEENRDGDQAFLNVALAAHDRIAALLGLNAPAKVAIPREETPEEQMTDAQLRDALRAELDDIDRAGAIDTTSESIDADGQA